MVLFGTAPRRFSSCPALDCSTWGVFGAAPSAAPPAVGVEAVSKAPARPAPADVSRRGAIFSSNRRSRRSWKTQFRLLQLWLRHHMERAAKRALGMFAGAGAGGAPICSSSSPSAECEGEKGREIWLIWTVVYSDFESDISYLSSRVVGAGRSGAK
jgi:hypothetical protein